MYIGKEPLVGNYQVCDAISVVNGQAAYTLQVSSTNVVPESANHILCSLNGVIQKPGSSFTVSSSTLTFSSNLATGDSIDFVILLGDTLSVGTPSDSTVTSAKLSGNIVTPGTLDVNGQELILDADADTSITADTDDQIDFKIANTDHIKFLSSSGDTVIQPMTDTKDIIFKQYDGTSVLAINDGAYAEFLGAGIVPEATLTDASTVTWNSLTQSVSKVTLGGNRTIGLASGGVSGAFISILLIQDGSGSRTVTWNAAYEFTGDTAPTLTTTANKGDLFVFRYNGAKWLEVGRNLNLTLS